jgi:hypothetical protein
MSWKTKTRGRVLAAFLASRGGMVKVDVSEHYPIGDFAPDEKVVLFLLHCPPPIGVIRMVPKNRLYSQAHWLRGKVGRIAAEALPRGAADEALVTMTAGTFAALTSIVMDARPTGPEWADRHERNT